MKKLFLASTLVFLLAFTFNAFAQQVESGSFSASSATSHYTLDQNSGDRVVTLEKTFATPFDKMPVIVLSVNQIDAPSSSNLRYEVKAVSISRDNFTIQIKTWSDSKINSIAGTWLAISK